MLFNSQKYLIFFLVVVVAYYLIPRKRRWIFLLIASYYFYACTKLEYIGILMFSTIVDYISGIRMSKSTNNRHRILWLYLSISTNIGLLCFFKYINFLDDSVRYFFNYFNVFSNLPHFNLLWPVGISFYTFQALSYTIDVYRNSIKAEKHIGYFAVYVSFFPQLLAGPIERASKLIPQHRSVHKYNYDRITDGIKLMIWGFFKKIVIADNIAIYVTKVYDSPNDYYGFSIIMAVVLFAFQVFCDFSGYTDIAIGSAKILGYDLTNNFRRPFFSKSMTEFWGRWHITLSGWFRDYVFIPLYSFNNKLFHKIPLKTRHKIIYSLSIFITLLLLGLWHGSHLKFIIMGSIFGGIIIIEQLTQNYRTRFWEYTQLNRVNFLKKMIQIGLTFFLFSLTTIFFRANNIVDATAIINNFFKFSFINIIPDFKIVIYEVWKILLLILLLLIVDLIERKKSIADFFSTKPKYLVWWFYIMLVLFILANSNFASMPFIYFYF
jgi:alginate O-acetyltransferase complex protein AlgI